MREPQASAVIMTDDSVTLFLDGIHTITRESAKGRWNNLMSAIKEQDWCTCLRIIDAIAAAREYVKDTKIEFRNRQFYFQGKQLHNSLTDRIIRMMDQGFEVDAMIKFLENLMQNPEERAVNELYGFLSGNNLPITEDGHFLAYKRVRDNYTDWYSSSVDNSVGNIVEMDRRGVNNDPTMTCSAGLHFCSLEYLRNFTGPRLMLLKINPKDVVSIPVDYNGSKGRCCRYEVIDELNLDDYIKAGTKDNDWSAVKVTRPEDDLDDDDRDDWDDLDDYGPSA